MTQEQLLETARRAKRRLQYGVTHEQFVEMCRLGCGICGAKKSGKWGTLNVDHNHKTGQVRGVLCMACNLAVGNMKDSAALAVKMAAYLKRSGGR